MVRITFELTEQFINEAAEAELKTDGSGNDAVESLLTKLVFSSLKDRVEKGKTGFVVTGEMPTKGGNKLYRQIITSVISLALHSDNKSLEEVKSEE